MTGANPEREQKPTYQTRTQFWAFAPGNSRGEAHDISIGLLPRSGGGLTLLNIQERGNTFHVDWCRGGIHVVRGTLGTSDRRVANRLRNRLEIALVEGPRSTMWRELRPVIPSGTFLRFSRYAGVEQKMVSPWSELRRLFVAHKELQVKLNELASQTLKNYFRTLDVFEAFLTEKQLTVLQDINGGTLDDFKRWRTDQVTRPDARCGRPSLDFDLRHLHCVFGFACAKELIDKNPVVAPPQRCDYHISRPFTADEVEQWEDYARRDHVQDSSYNEWLPFWLLRWTGFRDRDAVDLCWREVFLDDKRIVHKCHKNHKEVTLPILEEENLLPVLLAEHNRRHPLPDERVLVDPGGNVLTVLKLYKVMRELGKRAGVVNVNPYRFRGTYAVEMLIRSNNVYYVANLLGDTIAVVERHYMPYVRELREHTRVMLEKGVGLRQFVSRKSQ